MESSAISYDSSTSVFIQSIKSTIKSSLVEKFSEGNERPCEEKDFLATKEIREKLTTNLKKWIKELVGNNDLVCNEGKTNYDSELLVLVIILCGQNRELQKWNNQGIVSNCNAIISETLKFFECNDVTTLLSSTKINIFKSIFQVLCTDLTAETWKCFPASVFCYKWILEMIEQPELTKYLNFVLPPALLLTDDYVTENKIIGVECLNHIVSNTTIAELQFCGHGEVIYSALMPLLRLKETQLLQVTIPCLVLLTNKLEFDLGKRPSEKWSKFDNVLEIFLENMELEQTIDLRNCYISNLKLLITASGHGIVRWSKRLFRILNEYMQTAGKYNDEKTINISVKAIEKYMEISRSIIDFHCKTLFYTLLVAFHSTVGCASGTQKESNDLVIKCIKELFLSISLEERENIAEEIKTSLISKNYSEFYGQIKEFF